MSSNVEGECAFNDQNSVWSNSLICLVDVIVGCLMICRQLPKQNNWYHHWLGRKSDDPTQAFLHSTSTSNSLHRPHTKNVPNSKSSPSLWFSEARVDVWRHRVLVVDRCGLVLRFVAKQFLNSLGVHRCDPRFLKGCGHETATFKAKVHCADMHSIRLKPSFLLAKQ